MKELINALGTSAGWQVVAQLLLLVGVLGAGLYAVLERAYRQRISYLKEQVADLRSSIDERVTRRTEELQIKVDNMKGVHSDLLSILYVSDRFIDDVLGDIVRNQFFDKFMDFVQQAKEQSAKEGAGHGWHPCQDDSLLKLISQTSNLCARYECNSNHSIRVHKDLRKQGLL